MMNNESTTEVVNPIKLAHYVDLDMAIESDDPSEILAEATIYAASFARLPLEVFTVSLVTPNGLGGGWPVVRFTSDHDWLVQLVDTYQSEGEEWRQH